MQGGRTLLFSLMMTLLLASSTVGCFGPDYHLGVPYREQEAYNYCVPASILMWRLYDGLPELSQSTIFNGLGGAPCDGLDAAYGVALYTASGYDAYFDHVFGPSETERNEMVSRTDHFGGRGCTCDGSCLSYEKTMWESSMEGSTRKKEHLLAVELLVLSQPRSLLLAPTSTTRPECGSPISVKPSIPSAGQVISGSAAGAWSSNYSAYGDSVAVYGGGGGCLPGECGPPKY